jgi:hypothetical protein
MEPLIFRNITSQPKTIAELCLLKHDKTAMQKGKAKQMPRSFIKL